MGRQPSAVLARGFTLLELVVTLLVLALAVAVVGPAVGRSSATIRARAEVARFSALLRQAREQAVATGRTHVVVLDPAGGQLTVLAGGETRTSRPWPPDFRLEGVGDAVTVRFEPHGVSSGGDFRVTSGGTRYRVRVDPLTGRVRAERT